MDKSELKEASIKFFDIIEQFIKVSGYGPKDLSLFDNNKSLDREKKELFLKIELLEKSLELLRFEKKYLETNLRMEEFIQGKINFEGDRVHFISPVKYTKPGSGTPAIRLQPKLLLFLLLYHRSAYDVFGIIDNFIRRIWDQLEILDFKKTRTGVIRCFTNTRFAANTLRAYGLLRFTDREAYKTWILSLPGFLVASKVLEERNWNLAVVEKGYKNELHPAILQASEGLQTYDQFVGRLAAICKPNIEVFKTFGGVLKTSYTLLNEYWRNIQNQSLSKDERRKESLKRIRMIEDLPEIEKFYNEFSTCLKIEDMLKTLGIQSTYH